jgi:hypothetical protein
MILTLVAGTVLAISSPAAEKKPAQVRDFPFWSAPKRPHARDFVPGLSAALQLTPEQIEKIEAACRETIDTPEARGKNAPGAAAAWDRIHRLVADILTAEQKTLIEKINDAYEKSLEAAAEEYQAQLDGAKGNAEETDRLRKLQNEALADKFGKRLDAILTDSQKEALKKAADAKKKAEANKPQK